MWGWLFGIWGTLMTTFAIVGQSPLDYVESPPHYPSPLGGRVEGDDKWAESYNRAREFVSQMTLLEKVNLTSGIGWKQGKCVGNTGDVPRLDLAGICLQDGPLGVRFSDLVTGFPAGITAGGTFNKDLIYQRGAAIAKEFRGKGVDVVLGPSTGPMGAKALGGRNWEGFGSDPYLQGIAGALTVEGIQEQGVMANAKHFIANEQEHFRQLVEWRDDYGYKDLKGQVSSNLDDRALHEIYAWPFADMIHSGVSSLMCSYNKINNSLGCQNSYLMNKIAKEELGFEGFIVSDWFGQQSGVASVLAGLDMGMPGNDRENPGFMSANLTTMVMNGTIPEWRLNDMAMRIMAAYYYVGLDETRKQVGGPNFNSWSKDTLGSVPEGSPVELVNEHVDVQTKFSRDTAYKVSLEAITLLKNLDNTLPLTQGVAHREIQRISVLGLGAAAAPRGPNCPDSQACSEGVMASGWGSGTAEFPFLKIPVEEISSKAVEQGKSVNWNFETTVTPDYDETVLHSDVNIIFALADAGEGSRIVHGNYGDRNNASLWHNADVLIKHAATRNANNVVVITSPGPVNVEQWIDHPNITAVLFTPPGGQYTGQTIADILFGDYNPSGRLPFTIARDDEDYIPIVRNVPKGGLPQDSFDESIYIDYRFFDQFNKTPRFEFGYGLSYSQWKFSNLEILNLNNEIPHNLPSPSPLKRGYRPLEPNYPQPSDCVFPPYFNRVNPDFQYAWVESTDQLEQKQPYPYPDGYSTDQPAYSLPAGGGPGGNPTLFKNIFQIKAQLTNLGPYQGSYVSQLYVGFPQSDEYPTPPKQLRGFDKTHILAHHSDTITFNLRWKDLAVWDTESQTWHIQPGTYTIYVGSSSKNLELVGHITV